MFRFTIREMLLLMVVVALTIGWRLDREAIRHHNSLNKWYCYALLRIINSDGYSLEQIGPGRQIKIRTPSGQVVSSDDPYLGVPE